MTAPVLGWIRSYGASASTASMNASVTATEMLKLVILVVSSLQVMNSMMSGWSTRRMPMLAPRRVPPCFTTSVDASNRAHERHRTRGHAHGGADDVVLGPEPGEAEAGAAARLVHQRHRAQRVVDAALAVGERVVDRQHEAGGELAQRAAGVHQRGRVRHEQPVGHQVVEVLRRLLHRLVRRAVAAVGLGDRARHPPEQVARCLDRLAAVVLDQVALLEHRDGIGRQRNRVPWGGRFHRTPRLRYGCEEGGASAAPCDHDPAPLRRTADGRN